MQRPICVLLYEISVFHSSMFVIQTKDHCLSCSTTATNGVPLSQCDVRLEFSFFSLLKPEAYCPCKSKIKAAFHKLNLHRLSWGTKKIGLRSKIKKVLFCVLATLLCDCHQMDVCISVIIYGYGIYIVQHDFYFILFEMYFCTFQVLNCNKLF